MFVLVFADCPTIRVFASFLVLLFFVCNDFAAFLSVGAWVNVFAVVHQIMNPGEIRNDLYAFLGSGVFLQDNKKSVRGPCCVIVSRCVVIWFVDVCISCCQTRTKSKLFVGVVSLNAVVARVIVYCFFCYHLFELCSPRSAAG